MVFQSGYNRYKCKNVEMFISKLIFKIELWFLYLRIYENNDYLSICAVWLTYRLLKKKILRCCGKFHNIFGWFMFLFNFYFIQLSFSFFFIKISKSFATYRRCHPCFIYSWSKRMYNRKTYNCRNRQEFIFGFLCCDICQHSEQPDV